MTNTPSDLGTLHSLPTDKSYGLTSVDTPRVNRSNHNPQVRKEKEPDKFDDRSYFIVHFVYPGISGHFMNRDNS